MAIQESLQHHHHVGLGRPLGRLHHDGLVELINRTVNTAQPRNDRRGQNRADALVDHLGTIDEPCHPGQTRHGLLDEDVPRSTQHPGRARPRHHLHRQDAVPTQLEKRLVDADPVQA